MQPMDWNSSIAWIAFGVSLVGTIFGPLITTWLTNRYQLKLRKLDISEANITQYIHCRTLAIENFLSSVNKNIVNCSEENLDSLSESYFVVYQYISLEYWDVLDDLYLTLSEHHWAEAKIKFIPITKLLTMQLTVPPHRFDTN